MAGGRGAAQDALAKIAWRTRYAFRMSSGRRGRRRARIDGSRFIWRLEVGAEPKQSVTPESIRKDYLGKEEQPLPVALEGLDVGVTQRPIGPKGDRSLLLWANCTQATFFASPISDRNFPVGHRKHCDGLCANVLSRASTGVLNGDVHYHLLTESDVEPFRLL